VKDQLASLPLPSITSDKFIKLHHAAALKPPEEHSLEFSRLKSDLEEMVRLVEAVKLVDTSKVTIKATNEIHFDDLNSDQPLSKKLEGGRLLLQHANQTVDGYYIVEAKKRQ
jgi:Asp-tRNA(Asn)/Glu-tRNA(Gln) amidotransferase C subunit